MNEEYDFLNKNKPEGNGWSKYQLLVLQQLEDHNTVLQNLNKEIASIKQQIAVFDAEIRMWKTQVTSNVEGLQEEVEHILYDENGLNKRVSKVEREIEIESESSTKIKAVWALYGSILMFVVNILMQIASIMFKK